MPPLLSAHNTWNSLPPKLCEWLAQGRLRNIVFYYRVLEERGSQGLESLHTRRDTCTPTSKRREKQSDILIIVVLDHRLRSVCWVHGVVRVRTCMPTHKQATRRAYIAGTSYDKGLRTGAGPISNVRINARRRRSKVSSNPSLNILYI